MTKYRLRFVTKNSLYRVHSTHSNKVWLNELQGHKPKMFLTPADAVEFAGIAASQWWGVSNILDLSDHLLPGEQGPGKTVEKTFQLTRFMSDTLREEYKVA